MFLLYTEIICHLNATIECSEGKGKLMLIEDLHGAKCITFILLSTHLNFHCRVDIAVSALHMRKLRLTPTRSTSQTGMRCSAIGKHLWLQSLFSFSALFTTVKSGGFWVHVGFAISAAWPTKDTHSASHTQIHLRPDLSGFVSKLSHISNNARSSLQFLLCSQLKMSQNSSCPRGILRMLSYVNQVYAVLARIN